jgi:hypothetical protein
MSLSRITYDKQANERTTITPNHLVLAKNCGRVASTKLSKEKKSGVDLNLCKEQVKRNNIVTQSPFSKH